ncbi:hypothetical protein [Mesorhizobium sp. ANAO-SY3R2]|uniref:hypothetical protein n=1 Tax=Mesorhizobium sp. ANAO-SY3R2 TaxID=3166644 RepID=UPI00366DDB7F
MTAVPSTVNAAAAWLAETPRAERGGAAVPALVKRFGLTREQAIEAIRENNLRQARAT